MSIRIAVILTDAEKKILWVNQDFTKITGYTLWEVWGKKPGILQGQKSEKDVVARIREALLRQKPIRETITNYRKNGEDYRCTLAIYPIFNQQKELTNFIAFEVDEDEVDDIEKVPLLQLSPKYQNSPLDFVESERLYQDLLDVMEQQKKYLDPAVSLVKIANILKTNTKYLSQVINQKTGNNFSKFINEFRVQEAKRKLSQGENMNFTHFGTALQCGFRNKSTFYKVFKEFTGMTPAEFLTASGKNF